MSADQSTSSVDPPAARTSARRAARSAARATTSSVSSAPARSRRRRASAGLAPSVLTAIDSGPLRAMAGRMNVQSAGWSAALTQIPAAVASAATRGVDGGVAGGRDDEADAVEVGRLVRATSQLGDGGAVELVADVRGHDAHHGAGRGEPGDLAGGDRAGADDEHGDAGQVQGDGVAEPGHRRNCPQS